MKPIRGSRVVLLSVLFTSGIPLSQVWAQVISFNRQIVSHANTEILYGAAADDRGIYMIGNDYVTAGGNTYPEVFLRRLDAEGSEVWTRRIGSSSLPGG